VIVHRSEPLSLQQKVLEHTTAKSDHQKTFGLVSPFPDDIRAEFWW